MNEVSDFPSRAPRAAHFEIKAEEGSYEKSGVCILSSTYNPYNAKRFSFCQRPGPCDFCRKHGLRKPCRLDAAWNLGATDHKQYQSHPEQSRWSQRNYLRLYRVHQMG